MYIYCELFYTLAMKLKAYVMKYIIIALILFSFTLSAQQNIKPIYTQEGNLTKAVYFHADGTIAQTGYLKNNKREGNWISYDIHGKKMADGHYKSGMKDGQWFFWKENNLVEVTYKNNQIVEVLTWKNNQKDALTLN